MTTNVVMGMEAFSRLRKTMVAPVTAGVVTGPEFEIGSYLGKSPALLYVRKFDTKLEKLSFILFCIHRLYVDQDESCAVRMPRNYPHG